MKYSPPMVCSFFHLIFKLPLLIIPSISGGTVDQSCSTYPGFRLLSQNLMRPSERHSSRGCSSALGSRSSVASRSDRTGWTTVAEQLVSYSIITSDESSPNIMATSTLSVAFRWKRCGTVGRRSNGRRSDWHGGDRRETTVSYCLQSYWMVWWWMDECVSVIVDWQGEASPTEDLLIFQRAKEVFSG